MLIFEENSSIGSKHLESCQITEMVGNDWIEIFVKDNIHGFDLHRVTVAFEDIINTLGANKQKALKFHRDSLRF
jgi:hypothetical protein